jgi:xylose isomerase
MLRAFDLEDRVKINIEQNHAILAKHSFEHEIALAAALGILGSIDINRGDYQSGWDTDQFAMNVPELALAFYYLLRAGGFTTGGLNFDAKIRRQSIDPDDLLEAHVGSMDACARALYAAERMLTDGKLERFLSERYAGWDEAAGKAILAGERSLADCATYVLDTGIEPTPKSGRQEHLERIVNEYV